MKGMVLPNTPCVRICEIEKPDTGLPFCKGCGRYIEEIRGWGSKSEDEKILIWNRLLNDGNWKEKTEELIKSRN